jgi:hypothetical protein
MEGLDAYEQRIYCSSVADLREGGREQERKKILG